MLWLSVIFLSVTAVVAIAAWLFRRKPGSSSGRAEPREDAVDSWLIQRRGLLAWLDRDQVREAVRRGRAVDDPALREAAHALAAELLSGRLRDRQPVMVVVAGTFVLNGTLFAATGLTRRGMAAWFDILAGMVWLLGAAPWVWRWRRLPRREVLRALQANGSELAPGDAGQ